MGLLDRFRRGPGADAVRGTAQVVGCSGTTGDSVSQTCRMQLVVQAPGVPATSVEHRAIVRTKRWPSPGMVLPVDLDPADPARLRIAWDEVPETRPRAVQSAEALAAALRGERPEQPASGPGAAGWASAFGAPQVIDVSGGDLSDLRPEQRAKLQALGLDVEALAGAVRDGVAAAGRPAAADGTDERLARLQRLAALRASGVLTETEFQDQKRRILSAD